MEPNKNELPKQGRTTDPQDDEKRGNVLGNMFDKVFGDSHGDNSASEDESKKPGNQESIKDRE